MSVTESETKRLAVLRRPDRFTVRELLVLVASEPDEGARRDYVRQTFAWFFDRTRLLLRVTFGLVAAAGFAIATSVVSGKPGHGWIVAIAAIVLALLVLALFGVHRVLAAPLHREYLCCLVLVCRLQEYEHELRAALRARPQPEPDLHGSWIKRTFSWDGLAVTDAVERAAERFTPAPAEPPAAAVGRYLLQVLGPVPTDEYERRSTVKDCVHRHLRNARLTGSPEHPRARTPDGAELPSTRQARRGVRRSVSRWLA